MANEKKSSKTALQNIGKETTELTRDRRTFSPRVDIYETDHEIVLVADMPGVDEKSIDITLEKGVLTVSGHTEDIQHEDFTLAYTEYREGNYSRSFALHEAIDQDKIQAMVSNGVLRLHLPKSSESQVHKIPVKSL